MTDLTFDTGMKLLVSNQHQALYARSVDALRQNERNPLAFFFLGQLASVTGQDEKALELFAKATEHAPDNVRFQAYHAKALMTAGQKAAAESRADIAVGIGTVDAFLLDLIGSVYSRAGRHDLAFPLFESAVEHDPHWAGFHFNLAVSAQFLGRFDQAASAYEKAVSLNPKFCEGWYALVGLRTQTADDHKLDTLVSLFETSAADADSRLLLGHAIAKTLEDLGQYEESFDWLEKAKTVKRRQIAHDREARDRIFEASCRVPFKPVAIPKSQDTNIVPVFVMGLPRTGTTLVDRILSSHPDVVSIGEMNIVPDAISQAMQAGGMLPTRETLFRASMPHLDQAADYIMTQRHDRAAARTHVIDKTPHNFLYAGLIHRMLPQARIIVLRRNAMDSCLSNYRQLFALNNRDHDYAYDLEDLAQYYRQFDRLMTHWRSNLPTNRFLEINYEDIVFNQEEQTRRLLAFCDLSWNATCLRFHENTAPVDSASSVQVRRPLNADGIGRWKKYGAKLDRLRAALDMNDRA
ncbi:tetratricopeptide repeat-containing sulfotransferase family protein [uncultured Algimonas sp.]|uniref:tetratricopeptide repeat-containing sulfotransferase family protein n=1 Tax=uncultured Algimonas sp. TaxID=1547920 RepID=UPI002624F12B|nr:tetratricopeptide repeat-containing sulfotransferase family protein [uncultured Algimonas sp.]